MQDTPNRTGQPPLQPQLLFIVFRQHNGQRKPRLSPVQNTSWLLVPHSEETQQSCQHRTVEGDQGTVCRASEKQTRWRR